MLKTESSKNNLVLSVDPGGVHTGAALWSVDFTTGDYELVWVEDVSHDRLFGVLETEPICQLVYEDYKLYESHANVMVGDGFVTSQVIGVMNFITGRRNIPAVKYMASHVKPFFTDKRLRHLDLYVKNDHRRDAIRHFLYWWYFDIQKGNQSDLYMEG